MKFHIKKRLNDIQVAVKEFFIKIRRFNIKSITRRTFKQGTYSILTYGVLFAVMIIMIYPFFWVFISSFKTNVQVFTDPWGLPEVWDLDRYFAAIKRANLIQAIINSAIVTFGAIIGLAIISPPAAYVLSRPYRWMKYLFYFYILGMFIPSAVIIIPLYSILRMFGLYDSLAALIATYIGGAMPYCVIIERASFMAIPHQLDDSAKIDGLSSFERFYRVHLPLAMPGVLTALIVEGIFFWNDFFNPLILTRSRRYFTVQLALASFKGAYGLEVATMAAGVMLSLTPILIFYLVFADFIRKGIAGGIGIKGV